MRALLLLCLLAWSAPTRAQADTPDWAADLTTGFIRVKEGFYRPRTAPAPIAAGASAVARMRTAPWWVFTQQRSCTGFYISRTGYVLTAAHCVRFQLDKMLPGRIGHLTTLEHLNDTTFYDRTKTKMLVDWHGAIIVAAGRGVVEPKGLLKFKDDPVSLARLRKLLPGDWAILSAAPRKGAGCLSVSEAAPKAGDPLWALGYSAPAKRADRNDSPGGELMATTGRAVTDVRELAWFDGVEPERQKLEVDLYQPLLTVGDMLVSDADIAHGMSGGPVLDAAGKAVGLSTHGPGDDKTYWYDSAMGVTIKRVFADLRAAGADPAQYFDCGAR